MGIFDNRTEIFPEDFFNIQNPNSPWVSVQFRDDISKDLSDPTGWNEITINPSNFFDKLTIEDEGGFQKLSLSLVDREFTHLENIIVKSIVIVNNANTLDSGGIDVSFSDQSLAFKIANQSSINLRVRIGYAETDANYIDDTDFSGTNYSGRGNSSNTVIRSPWMYFMILGVEYNLTDFGLQFNVSAVSVMENFLDKAKILKVFAVFRDTPDNFFLWIQRIFDELTETKSGTKIPITVEKRDPPLGPKKSSSSSEFAEIHIEIGTNATLDINRRSYMTFREFLNDFCGAITPKIFNKAGTVIEGTDMSELGMVSPYTYNYIKGGAQASPGITSSGARSAGDKIQFLYPDPTRATNQNKIRHYIWREYGKSIVKSMNIQSSTNFAALNAPMLAQNTTASSLSFSRVKASTVNIIKGAADKLTNAQITSALEKVDDYKKIITAADDYAMVATSIGKDVEQDIKDWSHTTQANVIAAINDQVFNGSITIPGDPFYLFDNTMMPMEFAIRVSILRPAYIDDTGAYTGTNGLQKSYLSGNYLLKKITHSIDMNGYTTTLDVMRSPLE